MLNMKKALIAGAILTAFAANAFACEENNANKPNMKDRTNAILHENDQQAFHQQKRMYPPRPRMTPEEHEKFKNMNPAERKAFMKERREAWVKTMTPEQKANYEQHRKMMKERREARQKLVKEKMSKLTEAQRAEVTQFIKDDMAQRRAMGERLKNMTPEQREAIRALRPHRGPGPRHHFGGPKGHGPQGFRGGNGMMPPPPPGFCPPPQGCPQAAK